MYEQSAAWNEYYRETEPERRSEKLPELLKTQPDDGANALRKRLYDLRHPKLKGQDGQADLLLWQCVNFIQLYATSRFLKGSARREVADSLKKAGMEEALSWGDAGEKALYWEYRNAYRRYCNTTKNPSYRKTLFGLISSSEADKKEQLRKDTWEMSEGLAQRLGMEEQLRIWIRAVNDEYAMVSNC